MAGGGWWWLREQSEIADKTQPRVWGCLEPLGLWEQGKVTLVLFFSKQQLAYQQIVDSCPHLMDGEIL